jgi:hypothetical protein
MDIRSQVTGRTIHPAKVIMPPREDDHFGTAIPGAIICVGIELLGIGLMILVVKGILLGSAAIR